MATLRTVRAVRDTVAVVVVAAVVAVVVLVAVVVVLVLGQKREEGEEKRKQQCHIFARAPKCCTSLALFGSLDTTIHEIYGRAYV